MFNNFKCYNNFVTMQTANLFQAELWVLAALPLYKEISGKLLNLFEPYFQYTLKEGNNSPECIL